MNDEPHRLAEPLEFVEAPVLTTLARVIFVGVLFGYYWASALTKLGDGIPGIFRPSSGAYVQIWPRAMEAAGYDPSALSVLQRLVVLAGTWAEFVLPVLIAVGLLTRVAALGMMVFVVLQSVTDVVGHGAGAETVGAWFDADPGALILDQRAFWLFLLLVLMLRGAGPISLDRLVFSRRGMVGRRAV